MEFQYSELAHHIRLIRLQGKLDIAGTAEIETKLAACCGGENVRVVVDLSEVDFLASIGIRLLTLTAKSVASRGGKMVLLNPTSDVEHVLEITGILAFIPIYSDLDSAVTALLAS